MMERKEGIQHFLLALLALLVIAGGGIVSGLELILKKSTKTGKIILKKVLYSRISLHSGGAYVF